MTTFNTFEGTPDKSMIETGLPLIGMRNSNPTTDREGVNS